jgi:hypothetical protein
MRRGAANHALGDWQTVTRSDQGNARIVESEAWHIEQDPNAADQLRGGYRRVVTVTSHDGALFACNGRPRYQQVTHYTVEGRLDQYPLTLRETTYEVEPSPCERAFRQLTSYQVTVVGATLHLAFPDGNQTLWPSATPPPSTTTTLAGLAGTWRYELASVDERGDFRTERETWEFGDRGPAIVGTYRRDVTVRSSNGVAFACANATEYSYHDVIEFVGQRKPGTQMFTLREVAIGADTHPCVQATPGRALDEATAEQRGNYLVLDWRGKRREVLERDGAIE